MLSLTIRQLEYVAAVARHEGISAAAEMMNVSQPSISVALAQVEQHLGYKIFLRRNGAKLETTSKGRAFIAEVQDVLHAFAVATEGRGRQKMPVYIGCFSDLAPMIMAPLLKKLAALHPEISVFFKLENFETLNDELKSGRIDFAVSYDLGFSEEFDRKQIASLRPHIVVGVSHALAARKTVSLKELVHEEFVLTDQGPSISHIQGLFRSHGLTPKISYRVPTLEVMRSFAANGMGIGLSYTQPRPNLSYDGQEIRVLKISTPVKPEPIVIISNSENPLHIAAAEVRESILKLGKELLSALGINKKGPIAGPLLISRQD